MLQLPRRRILLLAGLCFGIAVLAMGLYFRLSRQVQAALADSPKTLSPLQFAEVPPPPFPAERWGGGEVAALAATPSSLLTAGAFGIVDETGDLAFGLPSLKVSALTLWRGHPVAGLSSGGLFLRRDGHWEEARSGFSPLNVRVLLEGPGGELWIGARQGLFLAAWAAGTIERLDGAPVRSLALVSDGTLLAGGEQGLMHIEGKRAKVLGTPDPWIDGVGFLGKEVWVLTPLGLARGPLGGTLLPMAGGAEVQSAAQSGPHLFGVSRGRLLRFDVEGKPAEEFLPISPRRVFANPGLIFADTDRGLFRKTGEGWTLARARPSSLPPGPSHVTALAFWQGKVMAGLFDGGVIAGESQGAGLAWRELPGSPVWGVNALMASEAVLFVASLRGAVRYDGKKFAPVGTGPAFALAPTAEGLAIGFGQGVQLPDQRFLSAFHGLPGNQALALVAGEELYVGTPSGLGAIASSKVVWRVTAGDGKLPNPWVTALALFRKGLFIGTYGGGVVRRTPSSDGRPGPGAFEPFPETRGFKVNTGCLLAAGGRLYLGTEGHGLFRLNADGTRFVPLPAPLPSPRITALLQNGEYLLVGTDEGLARLPLSLLREGS
jgi:hypothetical protein